MKKNNAKTSIGYVSKTTGLSTSGIRYYEEEGVIDPERDDKGGYRRFGVSELSTLLSCKNLRRCGFSLQNTVNLLNTPDYDSFCSSFDEQINTLQKEIDHKNLLIEYMTRKKSDVRKLSASLGPVLNERPDLYWLEIDNSRQKSGIPASEPARWFEIAPFADSSLIFKGAELFSEAPFLNPNIGAAIEKYYTDSLSFPPGEQASFLPAASCVSITVPIRENLQIRTSDLAAVRQFFLDKKLSVQGDMISQRILSCCRDSEAIRFDTLWIPVSGGL